MEYEIYKPTKRDLKNMWSQVVTSVGIDQFCDDEWQQIFINFCKCMISSEGPFIGMDNVGELANELLRSGPQFADAPRPLLRSATSVPFRCSAPPTQPQYVSWREKRMSSHSQVISMQPMQNRRYPSVRNESVSFKTSSALQAPQFKPVMSNAEFFKPPPSMQPRQIPLPTQQQEQQQRPQSQQLQQTQRLQAQALQQKQRYQSAQQQQQHKLQQQLLLQQHQQENPPLPPPQKPLAPPPPPPQQYQQHQQSNKHPNQAEVEPPTPKKSLLDSCQGLNNSQLSELQRRRATNFVQESNATKNNEMQRDAIITEKSEISNSKPNEAAAKKTDPLDDWLKNYPDKTASELASHVGDTDKFFESLPSLLTLIDTPSSPKGPPTSAKNPKLAEPIPGVASIPSDPKTFQPAPVPAVLTVDNTDSDGKKSKKKKSKKSKKAD